RVRAVRNRITECTDDDRVGGRHHVDRGQKEPRCRREHVREAVRVPGVVAAVWRGDERGLIRTTVIGHVTAVALDRITDRKVASLARRVIGTSYPRQMSAVAPYLFTRRDRYCVRPAEGHACVRAADEVGTVFLQTDGDRVEGERLVAEDIRKADANLVAPEIRLDDRTQSLCGCAAVAPVGERDG